MFDCGCEKECLKHVTIKQLERAESQRRVRNEVQQRQFLIELCRAQLKSDNNSAKPTWHYQFCGIQMCKRAFAHINCVSYYSLRWVSNCCHSRVNPSEQHGNFGKSRLTSVGASCREWLENFLRCYGEPSPNREKIVVSQFTRLKAFHDYYVEECRRRSVAECLVASYYTFRLIFYKYFPMHAVSDPVGLALFSVF